MALALGAPPDEQTRARVLQSLLENVIANDDHLTVGIMGVQWVLGVLVEAGRGDVALRLMMADTFPSIGRWIQQNMTTLCEGWMCAAHDGLSGSKNHPSFGSFDVYLHSALGGLRTVSNSSVTGWRHFIVQPDAAALLKLQRGGLTHETRFGRADLSWAWRNKTSTVELNVTVPIGSTAEARHAVRLGGACVLRRNSHDGTLRNGTWPQNEFVSVHLGSGVHLLRATYDC